MEGRPSGGLWVGRQAFESQGEPRFDADGDQFAGGDQTPLAFEAEADHEHGDGVGEQVAVDATGRLGSTVSVSWLKHTAKGSPPRSRAWRRAVIVLPRSWLSKANGRTFLRHGKHSSSPSPGPPTNSRKPWPIWVRPTRPGAAEEPSTLAPPVRGGRDLVVAAKTMPKPLLQLWCGGPPRREPPPRHRRRSEHRAVQASTSGSFLATAVSRSPGHCKIVSK